MASSNIQHGRHEAQLRDGTTVLAKVYKGETVPLHYSNRSQAQAKAAKENGVVIRRGRPFYVTIRGAQ